MYIYGIPRVETARNATVTSFFNNSADTGGAVFMRQSNNAAVVLGVNITDSRAKTDSGGGIYLQNANNYASFVQASFTGNQAKLVGGGLALEVGHNGGQVKNCSFVSNSASSGGGLGISTLNGIESIQSNSFPTKFGASISQSHFSANSAIDGGAIYSLTGNALLVTDSDICSNAVSRLGGGMSVGSSVQMQVENLELSMNSALSGGAIYAGVNSQLTITSCNITRNVARLSGGGVFLYNVANLTFQDNVRLIGNNAERNGGGLFLLDSPAWTAPSSSSPSLFEITLSGNRATLGSAVFFNASDAITQQGGLTNMTVSSNHATSGGTIFWVARRNNVSAALDISSPTNTWGKNTAAYGERIATQAVQFGGIPSETVNIPSAPGILPPFAFTIIDYYGQKVKQNAFIVSTDVARQGTNCGNNLPSFANASGSLPVNSGVANFSSVLTRCIPGGSMVVDYSTPTNVFTSLSARVSYVLILATLVTYMCRARALPVRMASSASATRAGSATARRAPPVAE